MSHFEYVWTHSSQYRVQVEQFWQEYLPGTPEGRFDWLSSGNPAGPAAWLFACDKRTGVLAGVISLVPRQMYLRGRPIRAGILGDFMVARAYRAFGPGLAMPKQVVAKHRSLGFDLLYTVPNSGAENIMRNAGFVPQGGMRRYVRLVSTVPYLNEFVPHAAARLLGVVGDLALSMVSRDTKEPRSLAVAEEDAVGPSFDNLWESVKNSYSGLIGDRSAAYLHWKHLRNPSGPCRLITLRSRPTGELLGYSFFRTSAQTAEFVDLLSYSAKLETILVDAVARAARARGCKTLCISLGAAIPLATTIRKSFFFDRGQDHVVKWHGPDAMEHEECYFLEGDRNL